MKVLVIDHDPQNIERIQRPLEAAGHDVVVTADHQAVATFVRIRPDIAVIEAVLPERFGAELCREIKTTDLGKMTPIVLITTEDGSDSGPQLQRESGCDRTLARPISSAELLKVCNELAQAPKSDQDDSMLAGDELNSTLANLESILDDSSTEYVSDAAGGDFSKMFAEIAPPKPAPAPAPEPPAAEPTMQEAATEAVPEAQQPDTPALDVSSSTPTPSVVEVELGVETAGEPEPFDAEPFDAEPFDAEPFDAEVPALEQAEERRSHLPWAFAAAAVVAALAGGAWWWLQGSSAAPTRSPASISSVTPAPAARRQPAPPLDPPQPIERPVDVASDPLRDALDMLEKTTDAASLPSMIDLETESAPNAKVTVTTTAAAGVAPTRNAPAPARRAETVAPPREPAPKPVEKKTRRVKVEPATPAATPVRTVTAPPAAEPPRERRTETTRTATEPTVVAKLQPPSPAIEEVEEKVPTPAAPVVTPGEPLLEPPRVLSRVEPRLTGKAAREARNSGDVVLRVLVNERGRIARVIVEEGQGEALDTAAVSAVLRWTFEPGTEDGAPVKSWTKVRFDFEE